MMMLAKFVPVFETKLVKKVLPAKLQNTGLRPQLVIQSTPNNSNRLGKSKKKFELTGV